MTVPVERFPQDAPSEARLYDLTVTFSAPWHPEADPVYVWEHVLEAVDEHAVDLSRTGREYRVRVCGQAKSCDLSEQPADETPDEE